MLRVIQWVVAVVIAGIFIGRSWSHLDVLHVPQAGWDILFAVLGGVNLGLTLAAVIIFFSRRNNS